MTIRGALLAPKLSAENELVLNLINGASGGTRAVYAAKERLTVHTPYVLEVQDGTTLILHNFHFLSEMRRQLSGVVTATTTKFSKAEQTHYDNYLAYVDGTPFIGNELLLVEALDFWLTEEVQNNEHAAITRDYDRSTHPWRKLDLTNTQEEI